MRSRVLSASAGLVPAIDSTAESRLYGRSQLNPRSTSIAVADVGVASASAAAALQAAVPAPPSMGCSGDLDAMRPRRSVAPTWRWHEAPEAWVGGRHGRRATGAAATEPREAA